MRLREDNIYAHELIGLELMVEESSDPTLKGLHGKVVFESKNMLYIKVDSKVKALPKAIVRLVLTLPDWSRCKVEGKDLIGRPEDRIERIDRVMMHGRR
ncbi:MAG: ribonuclease P protein subunit [Candidatus Nitrosocaldus sp.]